MRNFILTVIAVTAFTGSAAYANPKDDLMAADKAFSALSQAKGSNAAFLAYLADDGRIFGTGNEPPIYGKAAAVQRFADPKSGNGDPKQNVLSWVADYAAASKDGTLGYTDGHWLFQGTDGKGGAIHLTGHYVTVWEKDAVGAWKVQSDIGTNDPAK